MNRPITLNLDTDEFAAFDAMARNAGMSASALARQALAFALKNPALFLPPVHSGTMKRQRQGEEIEATR